MIICVKNSSIGATICINIDNGPSEVHSIAYSISCWAYPTNFLLIIVNLEILVANFEKQGNLEQIFGPINNILVHNTVDISIYTE